MRRKGDLRYEFWVRFRTNHEWGLAAFVVRMSWVGARLQQAARPFVARPQGSRIAMCEGPSATTLLHIGIIAASGHCRSAAPAFSHQILGPQLPRLLPLAGGERAITLGATTCLSLCPRKHMYPKLPIRSISV